MAILRFVVIFLSSQVIHRDSTSNPSGHYMYHQFNTQQLYVLPTQLYLCVLCGSENRQPLFPYTTLTEWFV